MTIVNIEPKLKQIADNTLNLNILQQEEEGLHGDGMPVHLFHRSEGGEAADLPRPAQGDQEADPGPQVAGDRRGAPGGEEDQAGHGLV